MRPTLALACSRRLVREEELTSLPLARSNNDGAALGRRTEGLNSDELEGKPMPVQDQHLDILDTKPTGVQGHPFKAVRCYAGDSVSLAQDERGRLKAWGTIRVRPLLPLRARRSRRS